MNMDSLNIRYRFLGKGLAVLFLCLVCSVPAAMAQRPGGQDMAERMKAQVDEVVKALGLQGEKEVQVRQILGTESEERASIMQGFQGQDRNARQAMREEMTELGERTSEKLAAVLSEEEMEKYKKVQAEIQERRRSQFGGRRGGGGQPRIN
ncbi:MAG: hypothetical protein AB8G77_13565 [Rhodothermales bacterium]